MPTAQGFVKCDVNKVVGTFELDDGPHHLSVDIKPTGSFKCSKATLTYGTIDQLVGPCVWTGTAKKASLQMKLGGGVTITGHFDDPRASTILVSGTGTWKADATPSDQPEIQAVAGAAAFENTAPVLDPATKREREDELLNSGNPIIAIFGQSGVGKSTFINLITSEKQKVGKGLQSCTSEISIIEATICGKPIVVIDTPGIDDTRPGMKEADILVAIASRLETMGRKRIWVTGVLILHRISDNKFSQTAARVSNMLKSLCGHNAMKQVALCTTMWDMVPEAVAFDRLNELSDTGAWKEMLESGASIVQIANLSPEAKQDAEDIVNELIESAPPVELAIQDEIINQGKTVAESGAGIVLEEHLRQAREEAERQLNEEREIMRKEIEASAAKAQEALDAQRLEVEKLRQQAEEHGRNHQELYARLLEEQAQAERRLKELDERMRKEKEAETARMEATMRAREDEVKELRRQTETLAQQAKEDKERQERESLAREQADRQRNDILDQLRQDRKEERERWEERERQRQREQQVREQAERDWAERERAERKEEREREKAERKEERERWEARERQRQREQQEREQAERDRVQGEMAERRKAELIQQAFAGWGNPLHIINKRYNTAIDGHVIPTSDTLDGRKQQQWVLERFGSGYAIKWACHSTEGETRYLGQIGDTLGKCGQEYRELWTVQPAGPNTYRIAKMDEPTKCLEGGTHRRLIYLKPYDANAEQLWTIVPVGTT